MQAGWCWSQTSLKRGVRARKRQAGTQERTLSATRGKQKDRDRVPVGKGRLVAAPPHTLHKTHPFKAQSHSAVGHSLPFCELVLSVTACSTITIFHPDLPATRIPTTSSTTSPDVYVHSEASIRLIARLAHTGFKYCHQKLEQDAIENGAAATATCCTACLCPRLCCACQPFELS